MAKDSAGGWGGAKVEGATKPEPAIGLRAMAWAELAKEENSAGVPKNAGSACG